MTDHAVRRPPTLRFGGDYNPEQWDEATWREDVDLMRRAGVDLVTVGVFSWATLEPRPGERDFGWLDTVLDLLHDHGIGVDLATPTASPPPWLGRLHPATLPVDASGTVLHWGSRNQFCPSAQEYRDAALSITGDLARRYGRHPAVQLWHVGNELGQSCWCERTAVRFRSWLAARHGDLDGLNAAWGTAFWSQRYGRWEEVVPPRTAPYLHNPAHLLDFQRFCSDTLLELYRAERDVLREHSDAPVTTNLMGFSPVVDGRAVGAEVDVVANDHYVDPADPRSHVFAALTHDLVRSLGGGAPWLLMEQATGAVNWRPHNPPKPAGRLLTDSLQAVARGADAVCFFQWRASRAGSEQFHSAMLPHAGPDTARHREVRELGALLGRLDAVAGTPVPARAALVHDWSSWWASRGPARPTDRLRVEEQLLAHYEPLFARGVTTDVIGPDDPLEPYRLVVVPALHLLEPAPARRLAEWVRAGGTLLVGPGTGLVDRHGAVEPGRFPVRLRDLLGTSGEEHHPLVEPSPCTGELGEFLVADYAERVRSDGAEVLAAHAGGDLDGVPVVTRHAVGAGRAWYCSALLPPAALDGVLARCLAETGLAGELDGVPAGVEVVRRGPALFVLNHTGGPVSVDLGATARRDLVGGQTLAGRTVLAPRAGAVLVEEST